jgi:DNA polymerase-3 subunit epsilon
MIVLDIEASGLDPRKDSILSVGALDLDNPENQFYSECQVWPGANISDEALTVNGFTREDITDPSKESEEVLIRAFFDWVGKTGKHMTAGQNPSYDRDYIKFAAERAGINWPMAYRTIDTHTVCYTHMVLHGITPPMLKGRSDLNSDKIMAYVGIPSEPHPHNALMGAKVTAEALSRLLYHKKLLTEFEKFEITCQK